MPTLAPPALQRLVTRFRRQRPLRAGSLLITIFGDAIAPRGGAISLGSLIRLGEPFGLAERLVRTSVARLAHDGWLQGRRVGRVSEYALADDGAARFSTAAQRIYAASPPPWDGRWTMIVLAGASPKARDAARHELRFAGFGEPAPGLFLHPGAPLEQAGALVAKLGLRESATLLRTEPGISGENAALVENGWHLTELDRRYRAFVRDFEPLTGVGAPEPESAFLLRTLLVHEYRRIHLLDPDLPSDLLPADWAGATARALCGDLYRTVFAAAESHLDGTAACLDGPLPPASAEARARFRARRRR
jgi:phenylacetic acid degradation operon negative regulatory protein